MIILTHVIIALLSIIFSSLSVIRPGKRLLALNYAFIAATVASGTYLIVTMPAQLQTACMSGLTYLVIASALTAIAHVRLARQSL